MNLSDERVIEFLSKTPVKSFSAMCDALLYLDGKWIWEALEYEVFDDALGDNPEQKLKIRVPRIRGISANALLAFKGHAEAFRLIRRRPRTMRESQRDTEEIIVFYELTTPGKYMIKALEAMQTVAGSSQAQAAGV